MKIELNFKPGPDWYKEFDKLITEKLCFETRYGNSPLDKPYDLMRRAQTIARSEVVRAYEMAMPPKVFFEYEKVEFDPLLGPNGK